MCLIFAGSFPAPLDLNEAQIQRGHRLGPLQHNLVLATLPLIWPPSAARFWCVGMSGVRLLRVGDVRMTCVGRPASCMVKGLIRALRPRQWSKNVLVFCGSGRGGGLASPPRHSGNLGGLWILLCGGFSHLFAPTTRSMSNRTGFIRSSAIARLLG